MKIPLDLTPDIVLSERQIPVYLGFRLAIVFAFVGFGILVALSTIFPDAEKYFDFRSYHGTGNTIGNPRFAEDVPVQDGFVPAGSDMIANATASGDFSRIVFSFRTNTGTPAGTVSAVRAYRSFLTPISTPVPFREGSLIRTEEASFLVADGSLHAFRNDKILSAFGIDRDRFRDVTGDEIADIPRGTDMQADGTLPNGTLLRHGDAYYQIENGSAVPFVSGRAFRSRFRDEDALPTGSETLSHYGKTDKTIGFISGTLVSYGEAVYAVEGSSLRPIDSPDTFLSKGYLWESVVPLTGDEFGIYERGKLYTQQQPHPDGTVFREISTGTCFLVEQGVRREIPTAILPQFVAVVPVPADIVSLGECIMEREGKRDSCEITWNPGTMETGAEYQFVYHPETDTTLHDLHARFIREPNRRNLDRFLSETAQKIRVRSPLSP